MERWLAGDMSPCGALAGSKYVTLLIVVVVLLGDWIKMQKLNI